MMSTPTRFMLVLALMLASSGVSAQRSAIAKAKPIPGDLTPKVHLSQCGDFKGHYGPMDYRTADKADKEIVEEHHFQVEAFTFHTGRVNGQLRTGVANIGPGFGYTLKSFPNHPAALSLMEQLGRKLSSEQPQNSQFLLECWFMRGFMIAPDDPALRVLYATYLAHRSRAPEAEHNLEIAAPLLTDSRVMQHLMAEAQIVLRNYAKAQAHVERALALGFQSGHLRDKLKALGKWQEPALPAPSVPASAVPAASASGS